MNRTLAVFLAAIALAVAADTALAQSAPPPLPALSAEQAQSVRQQVDLYRREVDARRARQEITGDEAQRLVAWREWQLAQQIAGLAPPPSPAIQQQLDAPAPPFPPRYSMEPAPFGYPTYPSPYGAPGPYPGQVWGPGPMYLGPILCAGRWGHNWSGRICI